MNSRLNKPPWSRAILLCVFLIRTLTGLLIMIIMSRVLQVRETGREIKGQEGVLRLKVNREEENWGGAKRRRAWIYLKLRSFPRRFLSLVDFTRWGVAGNYLLLSNGGGPARHRVTCDSDWGPGHTHTHTHTRTHTHAHTHMHTWRSSSRRMCGVSLHVWFGHSSCHGEVTHSGRHMFTAVCVCVCVCVCWHETVLCFVFLFVLIRSTQANRK